MNQQKVGIFIMISRKKQKLTQMDLAKKLGVSNKAVSKWETGKSMPDISLLIPLSSQLGISINELLSGEVLEMKVTG